MPAQRQPRFPGKAEALAILIAQGHSYLAASKRVGIAEKTARAWGKTDWFRARVTELRSEMTGQAVGALAALAIRAAIELGRLMSESKSDGIRLGAAGRLLDKLPMMSEYFDLSERVRALEERAGGDR